jgi:hypothetical protein
VALWPLYKSISASVVHAKAKAKRVQKIESIVSVNERTDHATKGVDNITTLKDPSIRDIK